MSHDFDPPNKNKTDLTKGRHDKCEDKIYMMSYGTTAQNRSSEWSDCSNEDFKNYYLTLRYTHNLKFCLSGNYRIQNLIYIFFITYKYTSHFAGFLVCRRQSAISISLPSAIGN